MTIAQILKFSADKLIARGIDTPFLEAEILLSHVLKKPQEFLFTHGEKKLSSLQISNFKFQISKRLKDVPAAYLTSHKEFYGLDFKVNQNVLIPRPETELMVDEALKLVAHGSQLVCHWSATIYLVNSSARSDIAPCLLQDVLWHRLIFPSEILQPLDRCCDERKNLT